MSFSASYAARSGLVPAFWSDSSRFLRELLAAALQLVVGHRFSPQTLPWFNGAISPC
jgi:hypothetical protein